MYCYYMAIKEKPRGQLKKDAPTVEGQRKH